MKNKTKALICSLFFIILVSIFAFNYFESNNTSNVSSAVKKTITVKLTSVKSWFSKTSVDSESEKSTNPSSDNSISPEFKNWFEKEVSNLNAPVKNQDSKEADLKNFILNSKPKELLYLADQAINLQLPANQRVLSVYLLSLSPDLASEALLKIIKTKLTIAESPNEHSTEEVLSMQEKTIRRMALDSLLTRAETDVEFRSKLWIEIQEIEDESLKNYAVKRFSELLQKGL